MIRSIRIVASIAVVTAALALVERCSYLPCHCNREEAYVRLRTEKIIDAPSVEDAQIERDNVEILNRCIAQNPTDTTASMLLAANLRLLGHKQEAATVYAKALQYERRPELYLGLGILQFELGQRDAALENLVRARMFNQWLDVDVPLMIRDEVRARATALYPDR